jgi:hypothetical protein
MSVLSVRQVLAGQGIARGDAKLPADDSYRQRYIDDIAKEFGKPLKFTKEGVWHDGEQQVDEARRFIALVPQTRICWMKFNGEGNPPIIEGGLLYEGYRLPPREEMGDLDQSQWETGLDGKPADPWIHAIDSILQDAETAELFSYSARSKTARRAVGILLRHYDRTMRLHPNELPVINLKVGGYQHSEKRVGWVKTPVLAVVGRVSADSAAKPPGMDDEIPF